MTQRNFARYRVGDLTIDTGLLRVTRAGVDVALPKLSFDLLLALVQAAPNVLSNEELTQLVWPGLVVTPETVSQRVKLVRDALGDDPRAPRYIAGLRGRGYSILPPVTLEAASAAESATTPATAPPETASVRARRASSAQWIYATLTVAALTMTYWFWPRATATPPDIPVPAAAAAAARTVAVMPFQNLSADLADRFLASGISEMVNDRLARTGQLVVIARSSAIAAAERHLDAQATGKILGVRYLVEGSVQRSGEQLRVTARLINCESGAQLWSERFDRKLADIFKIQDEVADRIGVALEAKVVFVSAQSGSVASSESIDAYLAYLEGRVLLNRWTSVSAEAAAGHFERALQLDPKFAAAHVALAEAKMMVVGRQRDLGKSHLRATALKYAPLVTHALELDPGLGAAYIWRAEWLDERPEQQGADFRRGIALDPNSGHGLTMYADWLNHSDAKEALGASEADVDAVIERALLIDPLSPRAHYVRALHIGRGPMQREKLFIQALEVDPNFYPTLNWVGKFRAMLHGEFAESLKLLERAIASDPPQVWARINAALVYLDIGDPEAARDVCAPSALATSNVRFLLLVYEGKTREADLLASTGIDFDKALPNEFGELEVTRDAAMKSGDFRRLKQVFKVDYRVAHPQEAWTVQGPTFREFPTRAHAFRLTGHPEIAERILVAVTQWMDARQTELGESLMLRTRAAVYALQGKREAALQALAAGFRGGDRYRWWYTVSQDPIFAPMRDDPAFQAIAMEARQHAALQRALLADLRKRGDVPMRTDKH